MPLPFLELIDFLIPLDLFALLDTSAVQIIIDGHHHGRRFTVFTAVLVDQLYDLVIRKTSTPTGSVRSGSAADTLTVIL